MLCPKCRQPLEDGAESYICCANASLQWRCAKCAKVSEGFALPYGLCPHCGGKLEPVTPRQIDDGAALDGIRKAFEIELGGQAFYRRAAAASTEPILQDLFNRFATMEREHMTSEELRAAYEKAIQEPGICEVMEVYELGMHLQQAQAPYMSLGKRRYVVSMAGDSRPAPRFDHC